MYETIYGGTTPLVNIAILDVRGRNADMSEFDEIWVDITDGVNTIHLTKTDLTFNEDLTFTANLTQEQTLSLTGSLAKVQVRAKKGTSVMATDYMTFDITKPLRGGQM